MAHIFVTEKNLDTCLSEIEKSSFLALDTETTGLDLWGKDELFVISITSDNGNSYYFNFLEYTGNAGETLVLPRGEAACKLRAAFHRYEGLAVFIHNAKFDLAFLEKCGIDLNSGTVVWCTMSIARLHNNETLAGHFSLASQAKLIGQTKDTTVDDWLASNKTDSYDKVPLAIIRNYATKDSELCFDIGIGQFEKMISGSESDTKLYQQENKLTRVLYEVEKLGVLVDTQYCNKAVELGSKGIEKQKKLFLEKTGKEFKKSNKLFCEIFDDIKDQWVYTPKGNPKFDKKVLDSLNHPVASIIQNYSRIKNKLDFFSGFLKLADSSNVLHTSFNSHGTRTGRLSSSKPNLQNLKRTDEKEMYPVRRAIIPRSGNYFAMIDYKQMEYRLALDLCDSSLIPKVLGGLDVHEATAEIAGCTRSEAKTVNFLTIYGGGIAKLAKDLKTTEDKAREIQDSILNANKELRTYIRKNINRAENQGWLKNCMGRYYNFKDAPSYIATNTLIQGGCADIIKKAMIDIHAYLKEYKTNMVLTIHDELIFEFPKEEKHVIEKCAEIMISAYKHNKLPMDVDIEWSSTSLADKQPWDKLS